ncbi:hypothetical protein [Streptomyces sp. yr375]|nr:hypothetical protein [Streptomyces sp. yr375]
MEVTDLAALVPHQANPAQAVTALNRPSPSPAPRSPLPAPP